MAQNCLWVDGNLPEEEKWEKVHRASKLLIDLGYQVLLKDYGWPGFEIWFYHNEDEDLGDDTLMCVTADEAESILMKRQDKFDHDNFLNKVTEYTYNLSNEDKERILDLIEKSTREADEEEIKF